MMHVVYEKGHRETGVCDTGNKNTGVSDHMGQICRMRQRQRCTNHTMQAASVRGKACVRLHACIGKGAPPGAGKAEESHDECFSKSDTSAWVRVNGCCLLMSVCVNHRL